MDHIFIIAATLFVSAVVGHMISLEIRDRRDHRRWKANLRRIQTIGAFHDDHGNQIGTSRN